jgi:hypothetical protein
MSDTRAISLVHATSIGHALPIRDLGSINELLGESLEHGSLIASFDGLER